MTQASNNIIETRDLVPLDSGNYYSVADENLLSHPCVRKIAARINIQGGRVLDIGCGSGCFGTLLGNNCEYTGIDLRVGEVSGVQFRCAHRLIALDACSQFPFHDQSFDAITSFWCFEHLPRPEITLDEIVRVIRPGGTIDLVFPNYDNPMHRCPSWWCSKHNDDSLKAAISRCEMRELIQQFMRRSRYLLRQTLRQLAMDLFQRKTIFEINDDPACDHLSWSRDRDAIHIVSARAVERYLKKKSLRVTSGGNNGFWIFQRASEAIVSAVAD